MTIRTRFAPSPTGYLHIGGLRTALYSWLYARQNQGQFILRIEDTDVVRSTADSVEAILAAMQWSGLDYDEGPYYQSGRGQRYNQCLQQLLDEGKAYRCYCTKDELELMRNEQIARKEKPRYDQRCRHKSHVPEGKDYVIRFKNPQSGQVVWQDQVKGEIAINNAELDDLVIARADGVPTYNFTVVVDDWDMEITHVIRGDDHVNNTPRQINLLHALGAQVPYYAHVPMILGEDGKRLSKRHGAVNVMEFKNLGYLPQALLNYLVRLGWSSGDQELFSLQELIAKFDLSHVSRSPAAFDSNKLDWLNQHYMKSQPVEQVAQQLYPHYQHLGVDTSVGPDPCKVIPVMADRVSALKQMAEQTAYLYQEFTDFEPVAAKKHLRPVAQEPLTQVRAHIADLTAWTESEIKARIVQVSQDLEVGMGKVGMPLRVAVTGSGNSPAIETVIFWLGKARVLQRIDRALTFIKMRAGAAGHDDVPKG